MLVGNEFTTIKKVISDSVIVKNIHVHKLIINGEEPTTFISVKPKHKLGNGGGIEPPKIFTGGYGEQPTTFISLKQKNKPGNGGGNEPPKMITGGDGEEPPMITTIKQDTYALGDGSGGKPTYEGGSFDIFAIVLVAAVIFIRK
ncbi:MAG: hypothetical protein HRT37_01280 [Alteromonadaceae bacterium]|nr:hypothetical protein [Alteromonadaceae bacterium]